MKTRIILSGVLLLSFMSLYSEKGQDDKTGLSNGPVYIYCTPELEPLASSWITAYRESNPQVAIELGNQEYPEGITQGENVLGFTIKSPVEASNVNWSMTVGRDVIVPVINSGNPFIKELYGAGVTQDQLKSIFTDPSKLRWGYLAAEGKNIPIHIYLTGDDAVTGAIKNFLGIQALPDEGLMVTDRDELIRAVQSDVYALGFCNLAQVSDLEKQSLVESLAFLPIDRNGNGKLDYIENIYADLESFTRGVWIGKYPKAMILDIYAVSSERPENNSELAFLNWILTSGQQLLSENGFTDLVYSERQTKLDRLNNVTVYIPTVEKIYSLPQLVLWISIIVIIIGLIVGTIIKQGRDGEIIAKASPGSNRGVFDENSVSVPKGMFYDRTHTWAFMEKDGLVKVGMDDFLQHVTGKINRVSLKKPGESISKGELMMSVSQMGKHLNVYSPINGTIVKANKSLMNDASLINSSPFEEGWVYMVEPVNWSGEIRNLNMADRYVKWLKEEFTRLKDFLTASMNADRLQYAQVVVQDGGALKDHILEEFGPEVWEDFQVGFIDTSK